MERTRAGESNVTGFDDATVPVKNSSTTENVVVFTEKYVFSTNNNPFTGIVFLKWLHILWNYGRFVDIQYYPRVLFITLLSILNSLLGCIDYLYFHDAIQNIELPNDPVFVIGHYRTGTTLLHNLLSTDRENFHYCNTFCVGLPSSFLWFEKYGKFFMHLILDKTRPMDSIPLHFDLPQEDELSVNK